MAIRPVPQRFPGAALSGTQTELLGSLAFPDAGGVQAVDKTGAVFSLAGASGVVSARVTDTDATGVSTALNVDHVLSSGTPTAGIGTSLVFRAQTSAVAGAATGGASINLIFTDVTALSQQATLGFSLRVAGVSTATMLLAAPTAGTNSLTAAGAADANLAIRSAGTGVASLQGSAGTNIVAVSTVTGASRLGFYGATPVVRALAIAAPATQSGAYVQADVESIVTAVNAIRVALTNVGITL